MTDADRFVEITSLLNRAGRLADDDTQLARLIGEAGLAALGRAHVAAEREGREVGLILTE